MSEISTFRLAVIVSLLTVALGGGSHLYGQQQSTSTPIEVHTKVIFSAMGDVPYLPPEDILLPKQISELPAESEFTIHVGDIKNGKTPCDEAVYVKVAGMLGRANKPVFIIPGDNEWNDCATPDQAWEYWVKYFMRFDRRWNHDIPVFRPLEREEHFSFLKNGVLFIGLNLLGGRVVDPNEWKERHRQCLDWVRRNMNHFGDRVDSIVIFGHAKPIAIHDDFFGPFSEDAKRFAKPILYLHGDGHRWMHDRPFAAANILRVQVDQGGTAPPITVTVTDHPTEPFVFDRRGGTYE